MGDTHVLSEIRETLVLTVFNPETIRKRAIAGNLHASCGGMSFCLRIVRFLPNPREFATRG